ncbi:DUF2238 domain-containing protein [Paenibacillus thalictri]|uniref:DUF2238 domain-containing protein n=1 Tax=Paenibacillus thalictri TaxID=2527873 RepID=A0A4Q9DGI5_9BACL|nr:DUF2238 domain-containing protein [Paenibacillus thalictri]TBL71344.1 DUF2238 domain-containing protein [Paenibacillus thalictri]
MGITKMQAKTANMAGRFSKNRPLQLICIGYGCLWMGMAVAPYSRFDWLLENLLIFAAIAALAATYRTFPLSTVSYGMISLFLALHTMGAHYSYNTTPVDQWLHVAFGFGRDNYDRIVHFSYGLLIVVPIREWLSVHVRLGAKTSVWFAVTLILATGAFYELIEMWVAQIVAPEIGTLFLGTQGDVWDTQHDMELALYGALITMTVRACILTARRASSQ